MILPLHEKLGKKLGKVGIPRKSQLSHLQIFENVKIFVSRAGKDGIAGNA